MGTSSAPTRRIVRFGVFELDLRVGELRRSGIRVSLQDQPLKVLECLLERPGDLVTREQLRECLWPGDTFVDFDLGVNAAVKRLRETLGDSAETPRFVETLPRRGYRFIAPVSQGGAAETPAGRDSQVPAPAPHDTVVAPGTRGGGPTDAQDLASSSVDRSRERGRWRRPFSARPATVAAVALGLAIVGTLLWLGGERFAGRGASAGPSIRSIAVLPLENFSRDPDQEYVADGITEALIARLGGGLRSLRVISRTSAMQFKGTRKPVPEIAKALAVDAVVTGSVQRSGDQIRITVHLIQSDPEEQLWSGSYDRDVRDILALQSEVALIVAKQVGMVVNGAASAGVAGVAPAVSPEAYDRYLKGRFQFNKYTQASIEESITHFEAALAADPGFAPAYVGLAEAYAALGTIMIGASPSSGVLPQAVAAATRALELDPTLADAYVSLGISQQQQWRWVEAEAALRRALELNPSHAHAHAQLGWWLLFHGRTEEAIASSRRGRDLDPLAMHLHVSLAITLYSARHYDHAARELQRVLSIEPDNVAALMILGLTLVEMARFDEAIQVLERCVSRSERSPMMLGTLAGAYARAGQRARAQRIVDELVSLQKTRYVTTGAFVFAYMGAGAHDQAFAWLERAYAERNSVVKFIGVNPIYDPVRNDPRFVDLLRRVGLDGS